MFTITKEFTFEAAHQLPHHDGKCARLHGHSWKMRVEVQHLGLRSIGPKRGMVMDFTDLKAVVQPLVEAKLDHHFLNDTTGLENPTSEELARWVFQQIRAELLRITAPFEIYLSAVEIDETCTSSCRFTP